MKFSITTCFSKVCEHEEEEEDEFRFHEALRALAPNNNNRQAYFKIVLKIQYALCKFCSSSPHQTLVVHSSEIRGLHST